MTDQEFANKILQEMKENDVSYKEYLNQSFKNIYHKIEREWPEIFECEVTTASFFEWLEEKSDLNFEEWLTSNFGSDLYLDMIDRSMEHFDAFDLSDEMQEYIKETLVEEHPFDIEYLYPEIKVSFLLATEEERGCDLNGIDRIRENMNGTSVEVYPTALMQLVEQQGYTWQDVTNETNTFTKSVMQEINEDTGDMSALCVLATCDMKDLADAWKNKESLEISKNATVGIYDAFYGAGSVFGIELEKNLVIPHNLIFDMMVQTNRNFESLHGRYDPISSYGFDNTVWEGKMQIAYEQLEASNHAMTM